MGKKKIDLSAYQTLPALTLKLDEVRRARRKVEEAGGSNSTALSTMHRLEFDILKFADEVRSKAPVEVATITPFATLSDSDLITAIDHMVAGLPEHMVTLMTTALDRRRDGPVLALVADATE